MTMKNVFNVDTRLKNLELKFWYWTKSWRLLNKKTSSTKKI